MSTLHRKSPSTAGITLAALLTTVAVGGLGVSCQIAHDHRSHPSSSASPLPPIAPPPPPATARGGSPPAASIAPDPHAAHASREEAGAMPEGYGHVPLEAIPLGELGFTTAVVRRQPLERRLRTTGWVTVDETRTSQVHAKVAGYVLASHDRFVGSSVKRGEPLVTLYSEGIYAAELELLSLVEQKQALAAAAPNGAVSRSLDPVVDAARKRFGLWDVSPGQVSSMEKARRPTRGVTLSAPRDGVILARGVLDGAFVAPSTELFVISDVSHLWIVFDVFERDMAAVRVGQKATFHCEGMTRSHEATVSHLSPTIDPATRSLRARAAVDNQQGMLRPGAFSSVELAFDLGPSLVVPDDAVLRTGVRDLVFIVKDGMAMPVEVTVSAGGGGLVAVEHGLSEGDVVVTGASFLIDSESRIRGGSGTAHQH